MYQNDKKIGCGFPPTFGEKTQLPAPYRMIQIGQIETLIMRIDTCVTVLVPNLNRIHDLYLKKKKKSNVLFHAFL